jgi:hypothetical protein
MLPYSYIGQDIYVNPESNVVPVNIALSAKPDFFMVRDITNYGAASNATGQIEAWICLQAMANGSYRGTGMTNAAAASNTFYGTTGTTNGFTFIDSSNPPIFASLPFTSLNHTTWVILMASTGSIQVGDWVRIINPKSAVPNSLPSESIVGQVTAVTSNVSITLGYVATAQTAGAGFVTDATTGSVLKFYRGKFYPKKLQVMMITQALQAKVYFAEKNDFTPGEFVDFNIPSTYGMTQLSFLTKNSSGLILNPARVLVVTNSATESSITIDYDTTGFTAFTYANADVAGSASPPFCFPAGSGVVPFNGSATVPQSPPGTNLQDAFDNRNQFYMNLGSSVVGAASATMQWTAWKADYGNLSNA